MDMSDCLHCIYFVKFDSDYIFNNCWAIKRILDSLYQKIYNCNWIVAQDGNFSCGSNQYEWLSIVTNFYIQKLYQHNL